MATAADTIREARTRAGLSQRELAARVGFSQPVIAAYESGRNQPTVAQLDRIVRAAGFTLDLGLRRIGPDPNAAGQTLISLLELADRLPQRHRRALDYPRLADARR